MRDLRRGPPQPPQGDGAESAPEQEELVLPDPLLTALIALGETMTNIEMAVERHNIILMRSEELTRISLGTQSATFLEM